MRGGLTAAVTAGVLAAVTASALPGAAGAPTAPRVRPGLTYTSEIGGCSFAFLFRGSDRREYVATAGHCGLTGDGREVWTKGRGPVVHDDTGTEVGRFAYAHDKDSASYAHDADLAFIRLHPGLTGEPSMCAFGGPTGLLTTEPTTRTQLHHNGGGVVLGATVPSRTAFADSLPRRHRLHALGAVAFGDSGSGTTTADGLAVGINVTIEPVVGTAGSGGVQATAMGMQRLDLAVQDASRALGVRLTLRTAPLRPTPLPTERC